MTVLVTGATGFVGGRLVPALADTGRDVAVLVRDADSYDPPDGVGAVVEGDLLDDAGFRLAGSGDRAGDPDSALDSDSDSEDVAGTGEEGVDGVTPGASGDAWVYESIVGALPGVDLSEREAVAIQFGAFEAGVLVLAWAYDLWEAALAGSAAVLVAALGSVAMLRIADLSRDLDAPASYYRLLFGSSVEVVLGVLAFAAAVTHLFVFDVQRSPRPLLERLFGPDLPVVPVYLLLLVVWDLCYRIGTSWWTAVVSLWRASRCSLSPEATAGFRRLDALNVGFALTQLALLPFVLGAPVLLLALGGHVVAVTVVSLAAVAIGAENQ